MAQNGTRTRSSLLWIGPLVSLVGFVSYWALFARWPSFRDHPWANVILIGVGITASIVGLRRVWGGGGFRRG